MPDDGQIYSANESNSASWRPPVVAYIDCLRNYPNRKYTSRYIGSLVADFHRNLLKGGVFLYPEDKKYTRGKLRLLYEAMPLAFIAEQAGGCATDGSHPIMDLIPKSLHERVPLVIGSKFEVGLYGQFVKESLNRHKKKPTKRTRMTCKEAIEKTTAELL
jgi:fructose-1,6-bisphosphatase I